jgi:hypothetical protein
MLRAMAEAVELQPLHLPVVIHRLLTSGRQLAEQMPLQQDCLQEAIL